MFRANKLGRSDYNFARRSECVTQEKAQWSTVYIICTLCPLFRIFAFIHKRIIMNLPICAYHPENETLGAHGLSNFTE